MNVGSACGRVGDGDRPGYRFHTIQNLFEPRTFAGSVARQLARAQMNAVIGGWQLSTVFLHQSGLLLTWGDAAFLGDADDSAKGPKQPEEWFNTRAGFTRDTATRQATYHYHSWPFRFANVRCPAMNNVDLSVNKRWKLNERDTGLQLRREALNAFNHVLFANPNTDQFNTAFGQITGAANYRGGFKRYFG